MHFLARHRRLRRCVTFVAIVHLFVWLVTLMPVWVIVAAFASRFVPGRWRVLRLAWFAMIYVALEMLVLLLLMGLWIGFGFGWKVRSERSLDVHHRLAAWYLRRLMGTARRTFGLMMVHDDDVETPADPERPALVFARHAGAGDSLLLIDAVMNGAQPRRPKIVLKDLLQLDPGIDVLLNRVGAAFVPSSGPAGESVVEAIGRLARESTAGDALVIFPEGGNFTPRRRERAIAKPEEIGRQDLADRARALEYLLPPKPLGASTAIDAAPTATIVFVGHYGLERLSTAKDIWRHLPMDHTIRSRVWRVRAEDVPPMPERELWLYDQWERIDQWLEDLLLLDGAASDVAGSAGDQRDGQRGGDREPATEVSGEDAAGEPAADG